MSDNSDITYPAILPANDLSSEVGDNVVQTFQLESNALRGRSVCLGRVLDEILSAHDYPVPVAQRVAETITLTVLLASMLKYEGIFTLQVKGDGPISMLVADMKSNGDLRGCATFDSAQVAALEKAGHKEGDLARFLGEGYIAFTVDQEMGERYQGIVALTGDNLIDSAQHYFNQSEQINTCIKMAVGRHDGRWRSGGIMIQEVPDEGGIISGKGGEDAWRRAVAFTESCRDEELLDVELDMNVLLHRLYHEDGVRVYEPLYLQHQCRCDDGRVLNILSSMSKEDVQDIVVDDMIEMRCEFCSHTYRFDPNAL